MTIEVDVYAGELEGLVVAEVEFESEAASREFEAPDWIGREVTGESAFANDRLAEDGLPGAR
jgi:CYTH domain-containing protein